MATDKQVCEAFAKVNAQIDKHNTMRLLQRARLQLIDYAKVREAAGNTTGALQELIDEITNELRGV